MKKFRFICMLVIAAILSSCNIDDEIAVNLDNGYYRAATPSSEVNWDRVYEFTPAPGQFINETKSGGFTGEETTAEDAIDYAERRLSKSQFISLGGFGGFIVAGFDHSVDNRVGYDLAIRGNAFNGSSEPGIVWVMQDENGDGEPNDTWYELRGSETGKEGTIQNYSVTYFRPDSEGKPVKWRDSEGNEGQIDYLKAFHPQPYYYPSWIKENSYTLTGTRLEARNYDKSGNGSYWVQPAYDWGYVDNFSEKDYLAEDKTLNLFDIANAMDEECKAVELKYVDFVKVQVACNTKSGGLGENSTEVFDFIDYGLKQTRDE